MDKKLILTLTLLLIVIPLTLAKNLPDEYCFDYYNNESLCFSYDNMTSVSPFSFNQNIFAPNLINNVTDTLNDSFLFIQNNNTVVFNVSASDKRYLGGGKTWYFTNQTSDVAGHLNASLIYPTGNKVTIKKTLQSTTTEDTIATFISEVQPSTTVLSSGIRTFKVRAYVDSTAKITQLIGYGYRTNSTGGNVTLIKTSMASMPLTTTEAGYTFSFYSDNTPIPVGSRLLFNISAIKETGANIDVNIVIDDDSFSLFEAPSPVGVTDLSTVAKYSDFNTTQFNASSSGINIIENWLRGIITSYNYLVGMNYTNLFLTNQSNNVYGNINASGYNGTFQYIDSLNTNGMEGSGIIWANGTNNFAEVSLACSGLSCNYSAFKVRLINTTNDVKYCNIQAGNITATDNTHNVFYIDNNCAVQKTSIQTYIATPISPGGIADFGNVVMVGGSPYNVNGIGLENKRIIKLRKLLLQSTGKHLSIVNGFNMVQDGTFAFNITSGNEVYLMDIVSTTNQDTSVDNVEVVYHTGAGTFTESDQKKLNVSTCDNGTGIGACSNPTRYRRVFIFMVGYNETIDETQIHQLLPLESKSYTTIASCIDRASNPPQYTLPSYYQYSAVPLYFYCAKATDTTWSAGQLIDIRDIGGGSGGSLTDTSNFVMKTGDTMTGNLNMSSNNITNVNEIFINTINNASGNKVFDLVNSQLWGWISGGGLVPLIDWTDTTGKINFTRGILTTGITMPSSSLRYNAIPYSNGGLFADTGLSGSGNGNLVSALNGNATFSNFFGSLNWSNLTSVPNMVYSYNNLTMNNATNVYSVNQNITNVNMTIGGVLFYYTSGACNTTLRFSHCTNKTDIYEVA